MLEISADPDLIDVWKEQRAQLEREVLTPAGGAERLGRPPQTAAERGRGRRTDEVGELRSVQTD